MDEPKPHRKSGRALRRILLLTALVFAVAYSTFAGVVFWSMHQPPEVFGHVMKHMPMPFIFMVFPFETAWTRARAGSLGIGDPAPDFSLLTVDKADRVQLSELNRHQPVVLVFGSYT